MAFALLVRGGGGGDGNRDSFLPSFLPLVVVYESGISKGLTAAAGGGEGRRRSFCRSQLTLPPPAPLMQKRLYNVEEGRDRGRAEQMVAILVERELAREASWNGISCLPQFPPPCSIHRLFAN